MTVVFAIDALEYEKVEEFDCENLNKLITERQTFPTLTNREP